jgi:hypothetical protein
MKRVITGSAIILVVGLFAALTSVVPAGAQQAKNLAQFCEIWQRVCNRTCPSGAGSCQPECTSRRATCMGTKCFPFSNPGPRCFTDSTARELTDTKYAPDPQRERDRRSKQGSGSR